jgi:hypothetical protein
MRIGQRVAHAGLSGQVDYLAKALFSEKFGYAIRIGKVEFHEPEIRIRRELRETRMLQADIVVVAEVVDADDFVAAHPATVWMHACR